VSIKEAVYAELFLQLYDNWKPGFYFSQTRGLINISGMDEIHLNRAILRLQEQRTQRLNRIRKLPQDGDIISSIQQLFAHEKDLMALKIEELQRELDNREE